MDDDNSYDSGGFDCSYATASTNETIEVVETTVIEEVVYEEEITDNDYREGDDDMTLNFGTPAATMAAAAQAVNNNANTGIGAAPTQPMVGGMNLAKAVVAGERINLSKQVGAAVTKYAVGMNWNEKAGIVADCDISIVLLDAMGNIIPGSNGPNMPKCMCYYGQQQLPGVKSYGDNLTGNDAEVQTPTNSDEQIDVDFAMLEPGVEQVLIIATTHSETKNAQGQATGQPGQPLPFGRVAVPVLTIYNNTNPAAAQPLYTFELDEEHSIATAVEVAKFYRKNGEWRYVSMADEVGQHPFGLTGIVQKYNIQ